MSQPRRVGPKPADSPTVGMLCPLCQQEFVQGDYTTVAAIGPGADPAARKAAREGKAFTPMALEFHWACVTGEEVEPPEQRLIIEASA